jgi:ankyrin repeat protein
VLEQPDVVEFLLSEGADPNVGTDQGSTPLSVAAGRNNMVIVKLLLEAGALINNDPPAQPVSSALRSGHLAMAEYLLEHGVHPTYLNFFNALYGKEKDVDFLRDAIDLLIRFGLDIDERATNGKNRFINMAEQMNRPDVVEQLIQRGAVP